MAVETKRRKLTINDDDGVNHFDRLPGDVILEILGRIYDAQMLCNCTLVSKKFASMIYQIKQVTLRLPEIDVNSFELYSNFFRDALVVHYFHDDENNWHIHPSSIQKIMKMIAFLRNFGELESIDILSACPKSPCTSPLLKWKAKLDTNGTFVSGLVSINAQSMRKLAKDGSVQEEIVSPQYDPEDATVLPLISCTEWFFLISSLIKFIGSLRRVTCTDHHRHGAFALEAEQIADWRRQLIQGEEKYADELHGLVLQGSRTRKLRLPVAGYKMSKHSYFLQHLWEHPTPKNAAEFIQAMNWEHPSDPTPENITEFKRAMNWEYGDEEKVLGEAMKKVLEHYME